MQISRLCLAASLAAIASVGPAFAARGRRRRPGNLSGTMLGLPFQPARRERDRPVACWCRRTESRIAARLPLHPGDQGSGLTWDAKTFIQFLADPTKLVPGTAMTVMVPDETGRANLFAYLATLKDTSGADASRPDRLCPRSLVPRKSSSTEPPPRPTPGFTPRTIMPARVSSISNRSRRKTPRTCVPSASTAPSNRPRCRRARSSMAG